MNNHIPSYEQVRESLKHEQHMTKTGEDLAKAAIAAEVPHLANAFMNQPHYTGRRD